MSRLEGADCPPLKCQGQPERRTCCPLLPFSLISAARGRNFPRSTKISLRRFFLSSARRDESCRVVSIISLDGCGNRPASLFAASFLIFCSTLYWRGWGSQSGQPTTMGSLNNVRAHLSVVTNSAKQKTSQLLWQKTCAATLSPGDCHSPGGWGLMVMFRVKSTQNLECLRGLILTSVRKTLRYLDVDRLSICQVQTFR